MGTAIKRQGEQREEGNLTDAGGGHEPLEGKLKTQGKSDTAVGRGPPASLWMSMQGRIGEFWSFELPGPLGFQGEKDFPLFVAGS